MTINILLIDDDPIIHGGVKSNNECLHERYGSVIYSATGENSALRQLKKHEMDLVFCDTSFDGIDMGPEIANRIREIYPEIRIIGVSTNSNTRRLWEPEYEFRDKDCLTLKNLEKLLKEIIGR